MTKWILLLVLLGNGLAYFWFSSQQAQRLSADNGRQPIHSPVPEGGSTLALLAERDATPARGTPPAPTDLVGPGDASAGDISESDINESGINESDINESDAGSNDPGLIEVSPDHTSADLPDAKSGAGSVDAAPGGEISAEVEIREGVAPNEAIDGMASDECLLVGPFAQRQKVDNLVFKLGALGVQATAENREEEVSSSSFWVYLPPLLSEKAAARKLQELKSNGVDSFIFQDGELKNGISLGFFAARENAVKRQQELSKAGYTTRIFSAPNVVRTYWVRMPVTAEKGLAESFWKELGAANPAIGLERVGCGVGDEKARN